MLELFAHQNKILELLDGNDYFAIFAEQGTAKTLPMLVHICRLIKRGKIKNALVVCPKPARGSWQRDIKKYFSPLDRALFEKYLTITTYDLIWRRPELDHQWDFMCLDESHYIKNHRSNRYIGQHGRKKTHGIKQISVGSKYRYIMTGTPIGNSRWEEIWAQFDFLNKIFGKYSDFEKRYCILDQYFKPCAYKNVDELQRIIAENSYRITKAECLDLPEKLAPERFDVELLEKKTYREMLKNYIVELDIEAKIPLVRTTKLRQICSGHIIDELGTVHRLKCEKIPVLDEFLDNWDKKLVFFAEYKHSVADISALLKKKKINYITLDGAQKDKTIWQKFQSDPGMQMIVCQYQTANAGIELSSQIFEQACDRIHRPGQKEKCSYILFQTEGTVEVKIWDTLAKHHDFTDRELFAYLKKGA
jgi:SNF2 family DNA or RNA helicase